jgi:hypothetical protein
VSKVSLVKELKRRGIPVPEGAKIAELEHRLKHWLGPKGWLLRLAKPSSRLPENPVTLIDNRDAIWLPDSRMARMIVDSKLVFVLDRCAEPPNDVPILDVPKDFNERWPEEDPSIEVEWDGEE